MKPEIGPSFDTAGFSVVLLTRGAGGDPSAAAVARALESVVGCPIEAVATDPLPLGDRDTVLAALDDVAAIVERGRIALYEEAGVLKAVTPESGILVVESVREPFFEESRGVVDADDARLVKAVEEHDAYVEVGVLGLDVVDRPVDASRRACRLAAALCHARVVAIAIPDRGLLACRDDDVLDALRSRDPFRWPSLDTGPSARRIDLDDRAFERATAEARARFAEFARAFRASTAHESFAVKIAVYEGAVCENLWFRVCAIDGERAVECELQSEPIYLRNIDRGDRRRFAVDSVLDWVHTTEDGRSIGGFTLCSR